MKTVLKGISFYFVFFSLITLADVGLATAGYKTLAVNTFTMKEYYVSIIMGYNISSLTNLMILLFSALAMWGSYETYRLANSFKTNKL